MNAGAMSFKAQLRSPALLGEWARYTRRYPYAAGIPFDRPIAALRTLLAHLAVTSDK